MRIEQLKLKYYQGIPELIIEFSAHGTTSILGTNATGKTTIANAICWLLFDKPYTGSKGYTPKTKGTDGEDKHNLHHSAEGRFRLADGTILTLMRDFYEDWRKKRGSNIEEFSGHLIDHFIDGVPVKESQYRARINNICDAERTKMLTMPDYFAEQLPWQDRRTTLIEAYGDISDDDVIEAVPELGLLRGYLLKPGTDNQHYTVQEYTAIANAQRAQINKELQSIPARIDEATKAIPDTTGIDAAAIDLMIQDIDKQVATLNGQLTAISNTTDGADERQQLAEAQVDLAKAEQEYNRSRAEQGAAIIAEHQKAREAVYEIQDQIRAKSYELADKDTDIKRMTAQREKLSAEHRLAFAEKWEGDEVCHACGRPLPPEKIEEAKAAFNLARSKKLEGINKKGEQECSKTMIAQRQQERDQLFKEIGNLTDTMMLRQKTVDEIEVRKKEYSSQTFDKTSEHATLSARITQLKDIAGSATASTTERKNAIQANVEALGRERTALSDKKISLRFAEVQRKRVEELQQQEKELGQQYEHIQQGIYLCEEFIRSKAKLLTDRINSRFETVRFKLFKQQINGGIADDCEVLVPTAEGLVPYPSANNAARINAGCEIIDALGQHWGVTMPVIIDNAESIVRLRNTSTQIIRLVVSEADEKLRIA